MMQAKVDKVMNMVPPTTRTGITGFLRLCGYYRRFIKGFSHKAKPLTACVNARTIVWDAEKKHNLSQLKVAVALQIDLARPNFDKEFLVDTDTSSTTVGDVLSQMSTTQRKKLQIQYTSLARCLVRVKKIIASLRGED